MPSEEVAIQWVEWSALGIELLAIGLIVATILVSTAVYVLALAVHCCLAWKSWWPPTSSARWRWTAP